MGGCFLYSVIYLNMKEYLVSSQLSQRRSPGDSGVGSWGSQCPAGPRRRRLTSEGWAPWVQSARSWAGMQFGSRAGGGFSAHSCQLSRATVQVDTEGPERQLPTQSQLAVGHLGHDHQLGQLGLEGTRPVGHCCFGHFKFLAFQGNITFSFKGCF